MHIPTPPTDSLYKFCALVGTVGAVVSLYLPTQMAWELSEKSATVERDVKAANEESAFVRRRLARTEKIIDNSIAREKGLRRDDPNKLKLNYSEAELKALLRENDQLVRDLGVRAIDLEHLHGQTSRLASRARMVIRVGFVGFFLFVALAILGYLMWYVRVQRHIDNRLRAGSIDA